MKIPPENIRSFSPAVQKLWALMNPCTICPRNCRVNRSPSTTLGTGKGELGFCGIGDMPVVSSQGPHFGEEGG